MPSSLLVPNDDVGLPVRIPESRSVGNEGRFSLRRMVDDGAIQTVAHPDNTVFVEATPEES